MASRGGPLLLDNTTSWTHPPLSCPQITAVCNFFTYIRYIQQGLVRQDGERPLVARGGIAPGRAWSWASNRISPRVLLSLLRPGLCEWGGRVLVKGR